MYSIAFVFVLTLSLSLPLGASHHVAAQTDCSLPLTSARVEDSWAADCQSQSRQDSYARYYTFTLTEQAEVTITLESDTDPYLFLLDDAGEIIVENDDIDTASGNYNSRVTETLDPGDYTIEATTYQTAVTGTFTLIVSVVDFTDQNDHAALVALYNATDGANWWNSTNWLTYAPLGEWYGVTTDEDGRVTELGLSVNKLIGRIPPQLSQLKDIVRLDLSANGLTGEIPPELGGLASLEYLNLEINELGGPIPQELGNLPNLKSLILRYNRLTETVAFGVGQSAPIGGLAYQGQPVMGRASPQPDDVGTTALAGIPGELRSLRTRRCCIPGMAATGLVRG